MQIADRKPIPRPKRPNAILSQQRLPSRTPSSHGARQSRSPRSNTPQQNDGIPAAQTLTHLLLELQHASSLHEEDSQPPLFPLRTIILVPHLHALSRLIQQPAHRPIAVKVQVHLGRLRRRRRSLSFDVEVHAAVGGERGIALCGAFQSGEIGGLGGAGRGRFGRGLGQRDGGEGGGLGGAPGAQFGEGEFGLRVCGLLRLLGGPRAEGDEVVAVVLFLEAVFEAVVAVAGLAVHAGVLEGVNQRFTFGLRALLAREHGGFEGFAVARGRGRAD